MYYKAAALCSFHYNEVLHKSIYRYGLYIDIDLCNRRLYVDSEPVLYGINGILRYFVECISCMLQNKKC